MNFARMSKMSQRERMISALNGFAVPTSGLEVADGQTGVYLDMQPLRGFGFTRTVVAAPAPLQPASFAAPVQTTASFSTPAPTAPAAAPAAIEVSDFGPRNVAPAQIAPAPVYMAAGGRDPGPVSIPTAMAIRPASFTQPVFAPKPLPPVPAAPAQPAATRFVAPPPELPKFVTRDEVSRATEKTTSAPTQAEIDATNKKATEDLKKEADTFAEGKKEWLTEEDEPAEDRRTIRPVEENQKNIQQLVSATSAGATATVPASKPSSPSITTWLFIGGAAAITIFALTRK